MSKIGRADSLFTYRRDVTDWHRIVDHVTGWTLRFFGHIPHWAYSFLHWVTHWPWATVAAFAAAAAALWVAHSETRERKQLLGRQTVIELAAVSLEWSNQAASLLAALRRSMAGTAPREAVNIEALNVLTQATQGAVRALMSAQMVFTDPELLDRAAETQSHITQFLGTLQRPFTQTNDGVVTPVPESQAQEQQRLNGVVEDGLRRLYAFGPVSDAMVRRGFEVYSPRRGSQHRTFHPRFDPRGAAAAPATEPAAPPAASDPEPGQPTASP